MSSTCIAQSKLKLDNLAVNVSESLFARESRFNEF
jgi:hypothetical protein